MKQKVLKKKLSLKKETVSQLNQLEMDNSKGGIALPTTINIGRVSQYTDPQLSCNTKDTCILCWYAQTEYPTCDPGWC